MEVIVMAGGLGTRLKSVVEDLPKPMAPVGGRPFLAYLLDYWITLGAKHFILSVGYKYDTIQKYFDEFYGEVPISYAIEEHPLGTGGALVLASQKLVSPEDFVVVNGDTLVTVPSRALLEYHRVKNAVLTVSLREEKDTSRYGSVEVTEEGRVKSFNEKGGSGRPGLINSGVYVFSPQSLKAISVHPEQVMSLEKDVFANFLRDELPVYGYKSSGPFLDIGIPSDYERAEEFVKEFKDQTAGMLH